MSHRMTLRKVGCSSRRSELYEKGGASGDGTGGGVDGKTFDALLSDSVFSWSCKMDAHTFNNKNITFCDFFYSGQTHFAIAST